MMHNGMQDWLDVGDWTCTKGGRIGRMIVLAECLAINPLVIERIW